MQDCFIEVIIPVLLKPFLVEGRLADGESVLKLLSIEREPFGKSFEPRIVLEKRRVNPPRGGIVISLVRLICRGLHILHGPGVIFYDFLIFWILGMLGLPVIEDALIIS